MLNCCTQAEEMERLLATSGIRRLPAAFESMAEIVRLLRESVKFEMPENGVVVDTTRTIETIEAVQTAVESAGIEGAKEMAVKDSMEEAIVVLSALVALS